jgi:HAMP domain-containing protein
LSLKRNAATGFRRPGLDDRTVDNGPSSLGGRVYFIANTITRPIETLRDEALAIAGGDLTRRVPAMGRDEIGAMGRAFNQMADELQESLTGLEQRSRSVLLNWRRLRRSRGRQRRS